MTRCHFNSHINYADKSLPASLADVVATPLRWASGKGKIYFEAGTFNQSLLSDAKWKRVGYRTMGIALLIFGTITVVPLLTTLLIKAAVSRKDEGAKKTCEAYAHFKEKGTLKAHRTPPTKHQHTNPERNPIPTHPEQNTKAKNPIKAASSELPEASISPEAPTCPRGLEEGYKRIPQKFKTKILHSDLYTAEEKALLFKAILRVYFDVDRQFETPSCWSSSTVTIKHLEHLRLKHPNFSILSNKQPCQPPGENERSLSESILICLPEEKENGPRIYAQPIQLNENHRTGVLIDLDENTVEYYNSFGTDKQVKGELEKVAKQLSIKYDRQFTYVHKTNGLSGKDRLQKDTYQCGIWTSKCIEERVEQGKDFDPKTLVRYNIADYREEVYYKACKREFFREVGGLRLKALALDPHIWQNAYQEYNYADIEHFLIKYGKNGVMCDELRAICDQSKGKL